MEDNPSPPTQLPPIIYLTMKNQFVATSQRLNQILKDLQRTQSPSKTHVLYEELLFTILTLVDQNLLAHEDIIKTGAALRRSTSKGSKNELQSLISRSKEIIQIAPKTFTEKAAPSDNVTFLKNFKQALEWLQAAALMAATAQEYIDVIETHETAIWEVITHVSSCITEKLMKP